MKGVFSVARLRSVNLATCSNKAVVQMPASNSRNGHIIGKPGNEQICIPYKILHIMKHL